MRTKGVRLNFYHWCKTPSSAFSKKKFNDDPNFLHGFGIAPSHLQLCFVQLKTLAPSARYSTWNSGYGSLKVIENYTIQSGTHDFLLTFHSNHWPISYRFPDKRRFHSKIANFCHPRVINDPLKGFPLECDIGVRGQKLEWWGYQMVEEVLR